MTHSKKVSIIILNCNGKHFLSECLRSLSNLRHEECEIIVVDNASTDGSPVFVRENFPWVKLIVLNENLGTKARNLGAYVAHGEYLIFLDNDVRVASEWFREMLKTVESNPTIGVCGSKVLYDDSRTLIQDVGMFCDPYGFPFPIGVNEIDESQYYSIIDVFFVLGACLLIKREIFNRVGGFDSKYFIFMEEADLCWRAHLLGYRVVANPQATIYHKAHATTSKYLSRESSYLMERNILRTVIKNYAISTLIWILLPYFALLFATFIFHIICRKIKFALGVMRAFMWNIKNFEDTWRQHLYIQQIRIIPDNVLKKKMLSKSARIQLFPMLRESVRNR